MNFFQFYYNYKINYCLRHNKFVFRIIVIKPNLLGCNVLSVISQAFADEGYPRKLPKAFIMLQLLFVGSILLLFSNHVEAWEISNGKSNYK